MLRIGLQRDGSSALRHPNNLLHLGQLPLDFPPERLVQARHKYLVLTEFGRCQNAVRPVGKGFKTVVMKLVPDVQRNERADGQPDR